jgi:integrase/recombinase XerC
MDYTPAPSSALTVADIDTSRALFEEWRAEVASRPNTARAYGQALNAFGAFMGRGVSEALAVLFAVGPGNAFRIGTSWKAEMVAAGLAPRTVNFRLTVLRSVVRAAQRRGVLSWALGVSGVPGVSKMATTRETRGPTPEGVGRLLRAARARGGVLGLRDFALVRVAFECGLRRFELTGANVADFDGEGLEILGKGRQEKERRPLSKESAAALRAYLEARGPVENTAPLFVNDDGKRLTGDGVAFVLRRLSKDAGIPNVRPHGLRHACITEALEASNGSIRDVQALSRHADPRTVMVYDDRRTSKVPALTQALASRLEVLL